MDNDMLHHVSMIFEGKFSMFSSFHEQNLAKRSGREKCGDLFSVEFLLDVSILRKGLVDASAFGVCVYYLLMTSYVGPIMTFLAC